MSAIFRNGHFPRFFSNCKKCFQDKFHIKNFQTQRKASNIFFRDIIMLVFSFNALDWTYIPTKPRLNWSIVFASAASRGHDLILAYYKFLVFGCCFLCQFWSKVSVNRVGCRAIFFLNSFFKQIPVYVTKKASMSIFTTSVMCFILGIYIVNAQNKTHQQSIRY